MMMERSPCVYILASGYNGTLYVGVTSDRARRVAQHRTGETGGFTARYGIHRVVYFDTMETAIAREKQLKRYRRDWKRNLIEHGNPAWSNLGVALELEPPCSVRLTVAPERVWGDDRCLRAVAQSPFSP